MEFELRVGDGRVHVSIDDKPISYVVVLLGFALVGALLYWLVAKYHDGKRRP